MQRKKKMPLLKIGIGKNTSSLKLGVREKKKPSLRKLSIRKKTSVQKIGIWKKNCL